MTYSTAWTYTQVHIPTGKRMRNQTLPRSIYASQGPLGRLEFLEMVNNWNRLAQVQGAIGSAGITWHYVAD